ncbi:MAG: SDR family NAD(P)-dependent oxidoreductase, partial [Candidatus Poribacteria bacterium]|nr:SDR family NAD(P)-dependent oxidoreductase [Candidatus Poribacteria bacterium]
MDIRLNDKVAVITGGSTGIGAATAIEYARAGAKVVFGDINETDAEETVSAIREAGGVARFLRTDVMVEAEVANL